MPSHAQNLSNWNEDCRTEKEVAAFLDAYYYKHSPFENIQRTSEDDIDSQMNGIDITFEFQNSPPMQVDEKAATRHINDSTIDNPALQISKGLSTFAFEVDYFYKGELKDGWLYSADKSTTHYLLCWLTASKLKKITCDDIKKIEVLVIERQKIINLLTDYCLTKEKAIEIASRMRKTNTAKYQSRKEAIQLHYSDDYKEKPVNILINKYLLHLHSIAHHLVTPDNVIKIGRF